MNALILLAITGILREILVLLVVGIVLGIVHYLIGRAPFVAPLFKTILQWLIIVIGAVILINFLLGLVGHPLFKLF